MRTIKLNSLIIPILVILGAAAISAGVSSLVSNYNQDDPVKLGYSVATGYEKNLRTSMNSTQTYVPVTSLELKDSTTLDMSVLGDKVFLTVSPGTSREEIVMCTDISTSTTNFTSCTRGLAFSGDTETAVSGNRYAHTAGSKVVMSNVHYVYEQYVERNENDLEFGDGTSSTMKTITFDAGGTTDPGFRWNTSTNQLEFRRYDETSYRVMETNFRGVFADFASLPSVDNAQGDTAITYDDYKMYTWNISTSAWVLIGGSSGAGTIYKTELLGSEATGADSKTFTLTAGSWPNEKFLQVYRNGQFMRQGASYDYITTTTNAIEFTYEVNDTDTISMYVVSIDLYNANWANVSEDLLPDIDATHDIGSSSLQFKDLYLSGTVYGTINEATSTPTASKIVIASSTGEIDPDWITDTQLLSVVENTDLTDNGTTTLHYHEQRYDSFTTTTPNGTSGTSTVAHNLGTTPLRIKVSGVNSVKGNDQADTLCFGTWDSTGYNEVHVGETATGISASYLCYLGYESTGDRHQTMAIDSVDSSNITFSWSKSADTSAGNAYYLVEIWADIPK